MHVVSSSISRCRRTENRDRTRLVSADSGGCCSAALDRINRLSAEWECRGVTTLAADGHDADGAGCARAFYWSVRSRGGTRMDVMHLSDGECVGQR